MKRHPLYIVDAFTSRAFHGNPAAVCLLRHPHEDPVLQAIASEMNLPETAFVSARDGDLFASESFDLRWFTPTSEVPICGHATLATAKVLYDELGLSVDPVTFHTRSGPLRASPRDGSIELDFPRLDPTPGALPPGLAEAVGPSPVDETRRVPESGLFLLRYSSPEAVRSLAPDFSRIRRDFPEVRIIVATSRGEPPYDFISRCFAPNVGIEEDPVTGMAHTALAPYWAPVLGKDRFTAYQASRRGGELTVALSGADRVRLRGQARIVLRGYLDIPS